MDISDCAECELCGMRLCGIRIVQNATRLVRLCGMQRDGEKYRLCSMRNATRLAKFCGIMIVWNAECNEMGEILLSMDELGEIMRNTD